MKPHLVATSPDLSSNEQASSAALHKKVTQLATARSSVQPTAEPLVVCFLAAHQLAACRVAHTKSTLKRQSPLSSTQMCKQGQEKRDRKERNVFASCTRSDRPTHDIYRSMCDACADAHRGTCVVATTHTAVTPDPSSLTTALNLTVHTLRSHMRYSHSHSQLPQAHSLNIHTLKL